MAVTKQQKVEILAKLVEQVKHAQSIGFAKTNTVTVTEFDALRADLRKVGATYTLAKKTLIKKAIKEALNIDIEIADLPGQVGLVCSNEDAIAGLSKVNDFIKKHEKKEKMFWVASVFEGVFQGEAETKVIASMPSRETLLGRLVGSMKSPISALARFMDAAAKELEAQGKATVGELDGKKTETAAPAVEEKKEEIPVETVKVEEAVTAEAPTETEEKKEDTPAAE